MNKGDSIVIEHLRMYAGEQVKDLIQTYIRI